MTAEQDKAMRAAKAADRKVNRAKEAYDAATTERKATFVAAIEAGVSQNGLAREIGKSVSRVRQIIGRA